MKDEGLSALWSGAARQVECDGIVGTCTQMGCAAGAVERSILGTPFLSFRFGNGSMMQLDKYGPWK